MQLSSLIGKKIVSPAGEQLGYVTGAYLSRDLRSLSVLSAADGDEEEFYLPVRAVRACADAVIAGRSRLQSPVGVPAPVGKRAFSEQGQDLGVVSDWLFGESEPTFLLVKDGVTTGYPAEAVAADENVVVYLSGKRPSPAKRTAKRAARPKTTENEGTMSEVPPSEIPETKLDEAPPAPVLPSPKETDRAAEADLGGRNLLGRRVVRSVFDAQGEVVALAGDRITPEVLSRARRKGRLLALTVNTLTNVY